MSTDTLKIINTSTKILGLILITTIAPLLLGILLIVVGVSADVVKLLVSLLGPLSLWSCMWYAYHLESKFPNQISNRVLNKLTLGVVLMMHFCVIIIAVPVLIIMNFHLKDMIILFVLYLFIGMPISIIFSYLLTFLCLYLGVKLRRKKMLAAK